MQIGAKTTRAGQAVSVDLVVDQAVRAGAATGATSPVAAARNRHKFVTDSENGGKSHGFARRFVCLDEDSSSYTDGLPLAYNQESNATEIYFMPDKRRHRGPHPEDARLFNASHLPSLREAVADFSWLLERDYAAKSALELVGNRYQLHERQRLAVMRCTCSPSSLDSRSSRQVGSDALAGRVLEADGYNVLTTVEAALSGGLVFEGRDGCYRDLASMHGTFRDVEETKPALLLLGHALAEVKVRTVMWYFDSPVSNSGRLKGVMEAMAREHRWNWRIEIVHNPDAVLKASKDIVASADSVILDGCGEWFNLARYVIEKSVPAAQIVNFSDFADAPGHFVE